MLEKRNAILIKDLSKNPSLNEWQEMGKPKVLILVDKYGNYELYDEIGFGNLYLVESGKIVDQVRVVTLYILLIYKYLVLDLLTVVNHQLCISVYRGIL